MAASGLASKREYQWDADSRWGKARAKAFGETLETIRARVGDTFHAKDIVEEARSKTSPIHDMFEWDNAAAAEKFREEQARGYIRALIVVVGAPEDRRPVRVAFSQGPGEGYTDSEAVLNSAGMRAIMLQRALDEARAWRRRYNQLRELTAVFAALDAVEVVETQGGAWQGPARQGGVGQG